MERGAKIGDTGLFISLDTGIVFTGRVVNPVSKDNLSSADAYSGVRRASKRNMRNIQCFEKSVSIVTTLMFIINTKDLFDVHSGKLFKKMSLIFPWGPVIGIAFLRVCIPDPHPSG
jgi:hypothetical protein